MAWVATLAAAVALGLLAERYRIPGGALIGAMVGAGLVTVGLEQDLAVPHPATVVVLSGVGVVVGTAVSRDRLQALRAVAAPALLSATTLVAAGIGVAWLLIALGIAPSAPVLATSPGGLSVLVAVAAEEGYAEAEVAVFHVVRIVVVVLTIPLLLRLAPVDDH